MPDHFKISIDRGPRKWAVFKNHNLHRNFERYQNEATALQEAKDYCLQQGCAEPEIVYPRITRASTTTRSKKR